MAHPKKLARIALIAGAALGTTAGAVAPRAGGQDFTLDYTTAVDAPLERQLTELDGALRARFGMGEADTAVGILDLNTLRLALVRPDQIFYAASVTKIAILLAWFQLQPDAVAKLDAQTRYELGRMMKVSDNELAAKYSQQLGLKRIQAVLDSYGFYDAAHGGGLWMGKHYSKAGERYVDPVGGHSHAATVRQLIRFYLLLEQDRLVSPAASQVMREIFASPDIAPLDDRFVRGLAGRDVQVRRKSGWWEDWRHDSAVVTGGGRHYIIVALTHHAKGDDYLVEFARAADDLLTSGTAPPGKGKAE